MRVLTTTLCYPTATSPDLGVFVQRRAIAVSQAAGVEVDVLSPRLWCPLLRRSSSEDAVATTPRIYRPGMFSVPVLGWLTDGLAFSWAVHRHIARYAAAGRQPYDLIDAHFEYPDGVGAYLAGRRCGLPVVVTVRGKIVSLSRKTLRRLQIAAMLRGVAARIAVSRSLAGWVHRVAGSDLDVEVIPNGVDERIFCPLDFAESRKQLGWESRPRYVLAVGHMQRVKGFDRLVSIMPELRDRLGDVRLVLAGSMRGESGYRRQLLAQIDRINQEQPDGSPAVCFTGPLSAETLNLMYNAADLLVSASRSEGWSNAIHEALAAGTPVVATDVGGNSEQIHDPAVGRLVPDGDTRALTETIIECCGRDWDRKAIAEQGRSRGWAHVGREVHAVFTRVVNAARQDATAGCGVNPLSMVEQLP